MNATALRAGFLTSVQDLGRTGYRESGVAVGGALDMHALRVVNLLVGNDETDAGLEVTFGGLKLSFPDNRIVAWSGGQFEVFIGSQPLPAGHAALVRAREELTVGQPKLGCRAWLAISGGIDVPLALGSRSTDWRTKFGGLDGRALRDNDQIPLGEGSHSARLLIDRLSTNGLASWSPPVEWTNTADADPILRFVRGADWASFDASAIGNITSERFSVSPDSDRMGIRLDGVPLKRNEEIDLVSEAVAPGTIQVPPSGKPIILLGDCQTIGGYPKLAHVITVDLPVAAQLRANDSVQFQEIPLADAHRLLYEREEELQRFRTGLRLR